MWKEVSWVIMSWHDNAVPHTAGSLSFPFLHYIQDEHAHITVLLFTIRLTRPFLFPFTDTPSIRPSIRPSISMIVSMLIVIPAMTAVAAILISILLKTFPGYARVPMMMIIILIILLMIIHFSHRESRQGSKQGASHPLPVVYFSVFLFSFPFLILFLYLLPDSPSSYFLRRGRFDFAS